MRRSTAHLLRCTRILSYKLRLKNLLDERQRLEQQHQLVGLLPGDAASWWQSWERHRSGLMAVLWNQYGAAFVSQKVPSIMITGRRYDVEVVMRNTGLNTWTSTGPNPYRLGSLNPQDNGTWGLGRVDVPNEVPIDTNVIFRFTVTAPRVGTHNFQWGMVHEGIRWLDVVSPNVVVKVTSAEPRLTVTATPSRITIDSFTRLTVNCNDADTGMLVPGRVWINGIDSGATGQAIRRRWDGSERLRVHAPGYPETAVPVQFLASGL